MKPMSIAVTLSLAFISALAQAAGSGALRITCDGDNAGASIYINDKLKGECPLDMKVPEGTVKLRATKPGDAEHEARVFEQEIFVGDGVAKKVVVEFGEGGLTAAGKQRRHEADVAEYNRKIQECLPKYVAERARLKQAAQRDYSEVRRNCIADRPDINWKVEDGMPREQANTIYCGPTSFDSAIDDAFLVLESDRTSAMHDYEALPKNAKTWCERQIPAPQASK